MVCGGFWEQILKQNSNDSRSMLCPHFFWKQQFRYRYIFYHLRLCSAVVLSGASFRCSFNLVISMFNLGLSGFTKQEHLKLVRTPIEILGASSHGTAESLRLSPEYWMLKHLPSFLSLLTESRKNGNPPHFAKLGKPLTMWLQISLGSEVLSILRRAQILPWSEKRKRGRAHCLLMSVLPLWLLSCISCILIR